MGLLLLPYLPYVRAGGIPSRTTLAAARLDDHPAARKGLPQANLQTVIRLLDLKRIGACIRPSRTALVTAGFDDDEPCGDLVTRADNGACVSRSGKRQLAQQSNAL
jgi:hypothetical protein